MAEPANPGHDALDRVQLQLHQLQLQTEQQSPIFRIPQEIRDKVFRLLLKEPVTALRPIPHYGAEDLRLYIEKKQLYPEDVSQIERMRFQDGGSEDTLHGGLAWLHYDRLVSYDKLVPVTILLVSKRFNMEASKVFYGENTFKFDFSDCCVQPEKPPAGGRPDKLNQAYVLRPENLNQAYGGLEISFELHNRQCLDWAVPKIMALAQDLKTLEVTFRVATGGWIQSVYNQCYKKCMWLSWIAYASQMKALDPLKQLQVRQACRINIKFQDYHSDCNFWDERYNRCTTVDQKQFVDYLGELMKGVAAVSVVDATLGSVYKQREAQSDAFHPWYDAQPKPRFPMMPGTIDSRFSDNWFLRFQQTILDVNFGDSFEGENERPSKKRKYSLV